MPAKSKTQRRLFGLVRKCQKTGECLSPEIEKISKSISPTDAHKFAATKEKNLPEKKDESIVVKGPFTEWLARKLQREQDEKACQCNCEPCKEGDCSDCSHADCHCQNCTCH